MRWAALRSDYNAAAFKARKSSGDVRRDHSKRGRADVHKQIIPPLSNRYNLARLDTQRVGDISTGLWSCKCESIDTPHGKRKHRPVD